MIFSKFRTQKKYLAKIKKYAGRNNLGRITVRHQGGGHKQQYRTIDWARKNVLSYVVNFEYDPNRSCFLAKIYNPELKTFSYIPAPKGLKIFDKIITFKQKNKNLRFSLGDTSLLSNFEFGDFIHNVELIPNAKPVLARSAGTYCQILEHYSSKYVRLRLPSGEQRLIPTQCSASFGIVGNEEFNQRIIGKAGRSRWLNERPSVRGVAMNPVDHPHGGGQGKTKGGRPSVTPFSWPTKGQPTRNPRKKNSLILKGTKKLHKNV